MPRRCRGFGGGDKTVTGGAGCGASRSSARSRANTGSSDCLASVKLAQWWKQPASFAELLQLAETAPLFLSMYLNTPQRYILKVQYSFWMFLIITFAYRIVIKICVPRYLLGKEEKRRVMPNFWNWVSMVTISFFEVRKVRISLCKEKERPLLILTAEYLGFCRGAQLASHKSV